MDAVEAPRLIEGEGTSDLTWQGWMATASCSELSLSSVVAPSQRLVVVAPHPDDEVLACGALMAMHAARGGEVEIVAVTDGEASHGVASGAGLIDLAAHRRRERLQGLVQLGLVQPRVHALALRDGDVQAQSMLLRGWLLFFLRRGDVVVSTWERDGHPDHDATGRVTRQTCEQKGCGFLAAPVWMWHWANAGDPRVPWERLQRLRVQPDAALRKQAALAAHVTQLTPRSATLGPVLGPGLLARAAWPHEYYFV